jgi:CubicO group peptidase (beta-lactamase class C family)
MKHLGAHPAKVSAARILLAAVLLAAAAEGSGRAQEVSDRGLRKVEALFDEEAGALPIGAMTVGVVSGSKLVWTKSYGLADIKAGAAANADTVYRIGSITKQFTALAFLQLRDRGVVSDNAAAAAYFPPLLQIKGSPDEISKISLSELATHRGGLSREPDDLRYLAGPIEDWEKTLAAAMPHVAMEFPQGQVSHYSNIGYAVLGASLAVAAKEPYTSYVAAHILRPLGMSHSGFFLDADMQAHLARGYTVKAGVSSSLEADTEMRTGRGYKIPNGGLFTTVGDLAKFVSLELGAGPPSVLDANALQFWHSHFYPTPHNGSYGFALSKRDIEGHTQMGHGGAVAGFVAGAFFDPSAKVGIICLRNTDSSYGGCNPKVLSAALLALAIDGETR